MSLSVGSKLGHWVAYDSNESTESGKNEIYVTPFPGPGPKRQISLAGGGTARWRQDGKQIFFRSPDGRLMVADVEVKGGSFQVNKVEALFGPIRGFGEFDLSSDAQKFLAILPPEGENSEPLTVVQNWTAGLKK